MGVADVAAGRLVAVAPLVRPDAVWPQQRGESSRRQAALPPSAERQLVVAVDLVEQLIGWDSFASPKRDPEGAQQQHAAARGRIVAAGTQLDGRRVRLRRPPIAGEVGDRQQWLPALGRAVAQFCRSRRLCVCEQRRMFLGPAGKALAQPGRNRIGGRATKPLDALTGRAALQLHANRTARHGVG